VRGLSFIIAMFGVIALLTLGAGGAWASEAAPMACHDMTASHDGMGSEDAPAPSHAPTKAPMVMGCCIACVSPSLPSALVRVAVTHPRPGQPARSALPHGRIPSPEHGPPRLPA
jgi:hypothetical protein